MTIALAILLSAIALFAVAYPVIARTASARPTAASAQETLDELLAQREAAFQALRELHFDRRVGKITDEDFVAFEAHLKGVAADALAALDDWEAKTDDALGRAVEAEIHKRRAARAADGRACAACGRVAAPEDKFCAACGAELPAANARALVCPACGQPFEPGDRFCAGCGQALPTAP